MDMKEFDWSKFTLRVPVKAEMKALYDAWTSTSEIEKWFLRKAIFRSRSGDVLPLEASIMEGCTYAWEWFGYDVIEEGRILSANGTDHIRFTFAGECPVDVKLTTVGDHVMVELTQSGIPEDDRSKRSIRLGCHTGWSFFLVNLKSVYEGGLDLRNKDQSIKGVVNS